MSNQPQQDQWSQVAVIGIRHLQGQIAAFQSARSGQACNATVQQELDAAKAALCRAEAAARQQVQA
jgi:hypothetical protein